MENLDYFNNTTKIEKSHKIEEEQNHINKHANMVRNYIFSKRINNNFPPEQKKQNNKKIISGSFNSNLILKNMEQINIILNKLYNLSSFNKNKNEISSLKNTLLQYLKEIRKELSQENISLNDAKNIFNENTQRFIESLFNDIFDSYMQIECLWIINNLMFMCFRNFKLLLIVKS